MENTLLPKNPRLGDIFSEQMKMFSYWLSLLLYINGARAGGAIFSLRTKKKALLLNNSTFVQN